MKVKRIHLKSFKRFTDLEITGIPETAKLVVVVGPNGSGKSSLFDAFISWHRQKAGWGQDRDQSYGESLESVLYVATKPHVRALLAGTGTEDGRIGYVALTRAKDLFVLAVPENCLKEFEPALQAAGLVQA